MCFMISGDSNMNLQIDIRKYNVELFRAKAAIRLSVVCNSADVMFCDVSFLQHQEYAGTVLKS